jgi:DNA-binding IclR family transcriptional regulator
MRRENAINGSGQAGRGVIGTAFGLLELVRTLEPVRLVDLAAAAEIPRTTVYRFLTQLVEVGAVRREGTRYRLGASLLALGAAAAPERQLRNAARRPVAELAIHTGGAAVLSVGIGSEAVLLDALDAQQPLGLPLDPGSPIWPGTAMARVHGFRGRTPASGRPTIAVDAGESCAGVTCVAAAVKVPGGGLAAVTALLAGSRPPRAVLEATRAAAERITVRLQDGVVASPLPAPSTG